MPEIIKLTGDGDLERELKRAINEELLPCTMWFHEYGSIHVRVDITGEPIGVFWLKDSAEELKIDWKAVLIRTEESGDKLLAVYFVEQA